MSTSPVPTVRLSTVMEPESVTVSGLAPALTAPRFTAVSSSSVRSPSNVNSDPFTDFVNVVPDAIRTSPETLSVLLPCTRVPPERVRAPLMSVVS